MKSFFQDSEENIRIAEKNGTSCKSHWKKHKKKYFWKKEIQNGQLKKNWFSSSTNSRYFFTKISWIGPLVSRIDWCEGHWCQNFCINQTCLDWKTTVPLLLSDYFLFSIFFLFPMFWRIQLWLPLLPLLSHQCPNLLQQIPLR